MDATTWPYTEAEPVKLWVDGQCFQTSSRNRGIGRYALELLRAISENHPDVELHLSLNAQLVPEAIAARKGLSGVIPEDRIYLWHGVATGGEAVEGYTANRSLSEIALVHHVNCLEPDVALSLSPFEGMFDAAVPLAPRSELNIPVSGVFYDAIPYRFPDQYLRTSAMKGVYQRRLEFTRDFVSLLCISQFATDEAREIFGKDRSVNISAGISNSFRALLSQDQSDAQKTATPFLLYVGGLDWRKNLAVLPKAFARLPEKLRTKLHLVLAGEHPAGNLAPILEDWRSRGLPAGSIRSVGHVSDEELAALYKKAAAVIQPSFMEGFGLTALEAIVSGTPVIAARAGALPEVVASDRLMFDPHSPEELAQRIEDVCSSPEIRAGLLAARQSYIERFNWTNSAKVAVAELRSVSVRDIASTTRDQLRQQILPGLVNLNKDSRYVAEALALAEPLRARPPRFFIDASSTIRNQYKTGIQRVVRNICSQISARKTVSGLPVSIIFCDDEQGWFEATPDLAAAPLKTESERVRPVRGDVVFMLDSSWDLATTHRRFLAEARMQGARVITCVYDTVPLRLPGFCDAGMPPVFRDWFLSALQFSTGFVCISKAVAHEVRSLLRDMNYPHGVDIGHWRLGADFSVSAVDKALPIKTNPFHPSFLMVGTLEPRKGQSLVIDAFEMGWKSGLDAHLTIVGKYGWEADHLAERIRSHPEYRKRLHWYDNVEDDELLQLYRQCDALISASYGEGFGLPIVEAGQLGVPVIASDLPVFREVAAAAQTALFFDTGSAGALLETLQQFIRSFRPKLESSTAPWPNWSESAEELLKVIMGGQTGRYEPAKTQPFLLPDDLGTQRGLVPLDSHDCQVHLRLVAGPEPTGHAGAVKLLVAVSNRSFRTWFGRGDDSGKYAIALSYHIKAADGSLLQYDNPRSPIVLALQPGDTHILPVIVSGDWIARGAAAIDIELVQEGVGWWGNPLHVLLRDLPSTDIAREKSMSFRQNGKL